MVNSVSHALISLSDVAPTLVTISGNDEKTSLTVSVQNADTAAVVYVGDSTVDSGSYGVVLSPGEVITFDDLSLASEVYAVSDTNGSKVAVMRILR